MIVRAQSNLVLPPPLADYDVDNERETRRAIQSAVTQLSTSLGVNLPWTEVKAKGGNDTASIQGAIDEMAALVPVTSPTDLTIGGGVVLLTSAAYTADALVLKHGVHVLGLGQSACRLYPSLLSTAPAVWTLDEGIVAYASIQNMSIVGRGIAGQHGMYLRAVESMQSGFMQGGLWNSTLANLRISGFTGEGLWLHAGGDNFLAPIQFINLDQVEVDCPSTSYHALRMSGECNQVKCIGPCRFDGPGQAAGGTCALLQRTVNTAGVNNGDVAPDIIGFDLASFQSNTRGITVERAQNVSFHDCHFEGLSEGVYVDVEANNIVVSSCDFANVGHVPTLLTGFGVKVNSGHCICRDNSFVYSDASLAADVHYVRVSTGDGTLQLLGSHFDGAQAIKTTTVTAQLNVTSATLDVTGFRVVFVNASGTTITTIKQDWLPIGQILALKAHSGTITLGSGGNIYFDSSPNRFKSPLVIPADTYVLLMRIDLGAGDAWAILAAAENANYVRPFGCNGQTPQTSSSIGGVAPVGGVGTAAGGWDTAGHRDAAIALLNNIRTALINNGIAV